MMQLLHQIDGVERIYPVPVETPQEWREPMSRTVRFGLIIVLAVAMPVLRN
jgi:hypothetical protein